MPILRFHRCRLLYIVDEAAKTHFKRMMPMIILTFSCLDLPERCFLYFALPAFQISLSLVTTAKFRSRAEFIMLFIEV